ncbi:hypothetical protein DFH11DRAFT_1549247 [Phellopilus nigrolimitatus]|nr:hypothetical protein DFH11DRAFT_1549247 [Phellopilus nigrolimitatus]
MHSIRSDVEPVNPSLVPLLISGLDISQYTQVVILTLLVYDTFITMDKEIKYFWNRCIGILGALSGIVDSLLIILKGLSFVWIHSLTRQHLAHCREDWMTILLIDYILLIRVLALHHQNKRLAACLRTLFGLEAVFDLALLIHSNIYEEIVVGELAEGVTFCGINRTPPRVWGAWSWVAPMVYGIILMVLALYKAAEHWRETAGFSQFTLVTVLIQDQAIYFIIVIEITANQLNVLNPLLANLLNLLGSPSLLCVLGSHLLVHLKEAGERGANGGTSYRMPTMSNIEFS